MKNRTLVALILGLPFALFLCLWFVPGLVKSPADGTKKTQASQDAAVSNALSRQDARTVGIIESNFAHVSPPVETASATDSVASPAPAGQPSELQFTNFAPATVLENMSRAVRQYGDMYGGNPVGTNPEITRQLSGENPKHINFLNAEAGMRVNEQGELVDPWGTPYFFHQLSGHDMEIHSAGPDKIMWTEDDLVTK